VLNNSAHYFEVGEFFLVDCVMYEVVHTPGGNEATVRCMDNGVFITINVADIICYLN
jgi:hypothetical protein